jgi:hypothetical protein
MASNDSLQRAVLPIPDRKPAGLTTYDAKDPDATFPPIRQLRPPAGAPNVLVILIDDVGFGASSAFGGPCRTPTAERLASKGLRYTRFHTTALCSLTLYDRQHFFAPNAIKRFSVGTKNKDLQSNADGSLTIFVQADAPTDRAQRANWLPAPKTTSHSSSAPTGRMRQSPAASGHRRRCSVRTEGVTRDSESAPGERRTA